MDPKPADIEVRKAKFIVGEVSRNWTRGEQLDDRPVLSELFERIIDVNHAKGYRLYSFALSQVVTGRDTMTETIIAVFERSSE